MDLQGISNNLKEIQQTYSNIDKSIDFLTLQNEELRKTLDLADKKALQDREFIPILEEKIEDLQRTIRKLCVEIRNMPKNATETRDDLVNMVINLLKTVKLEINASDIKDIFRLKARKDPKNNPIIIAELGSAILKTDLLSKTNVNKIYIALAQRVITYCIPVWGGATKTHFLEVERAQRSLLKVMYLKPYRFPTNILYMTCSLLSVRKLYVLNLTRVTSIG
ncbi:unnamed protein product [Arctia plantaginis]|uniref:Uncharacterized protein n=1 Tax=Arctia plantaginis TaxID=874455 RepID=A0A8S1A635_ARCPL|nr:unnamed protein product [Arctia plantaginis]